MCMYMVVYYLRWQVESSLAVPGWITIIHDCYYSIDACLYVCSNVNDNDDYDVLDVLNEAWPSIKMLSI